MVFSFIPLIVEVVNFVDKNITGRPVWGPTLGIDVSTKVNENEYVVQVDLPFPGDGKVTITAHRTKNQHTDGHGKHVIKVTVTNRTGTKIAVRFKGPYGHNNIMRKTLARTTGTTLLTLKAGASGRTRCARLAFVIFCCIAADPLGASMSSTAASWKPPG
ncbi:hypothetical protein HDU96_002248 [Phlyctochytrium bullatum]|nr:hypothetical protein HDU96_002248 [Phlyctochytrium bullatum]